MLERGVAVGEALEHAEPEEHLEEHDADGMHVAGLGVLERRVARLAREPGLALAMSARGWGARTSPRGCSGAAAAGWRR